jgi:hypothetical protein
MAPPVQRDSHVYRDMGAVEEPAPPPAPPAAAAPPPEPAPAPEPEPEPEEPSVDEPTADPEPEPEPEPEITMKNTKAEMIEVATAMGLDVNEDMLKREILALIEDA